MSQHLNSSKEKSSFGINFATMITRPQNMISFGLRILTVCLLSTFLLTCKQHEGLSGTKENRAISFDTYDEDWKEIKAMEEKGLGKSIIKKTNGLLEKALSENNVNQVFKSLTYRSKYINQIEEDAAFKILTAFEEQIDSADFPLKQLLHSAAGELYEQYYQHRRYTINERSNTQDFDLKDLRSWPLERLEEQVELHYQSSTAHKNDLRQLPTSSLSSILQTLNKETEYQVDAMDLRPSLYDLLLDRALNYYKRNEGEVGKAFYEEAIDVKALMGERALFLATSFDSSHFTTKEWITLKLYQEVLTIHQTDEDPKVLIDFDLNRLRHYYTTSQSDERDSLYVSSLRALAEQYESHPSVDEIKFHLAKLYHQWGENYQQELNNSKGDSRRWLLRKAHKICTAIKNNPTFGGKQAAALLQAIERRLIHFRLEGTYLPDRPLLFEFNYKNIDTVFFRLVKLPFKPFDDFFFPYNSKEHILEWLLANKAIKSWKQSLPNPGDFLKHTAELYMNALEEGNYYLIASSSSDFDQAFDLSYANFSVSNLSFFTRQNDLKGEFEVYVRNAVNGHANSKARIRLYQRGSGGVNGRSQWEFVRSIGLDKHGFALIKGDHYRDSYRFYCVDGNDTLLSNQNMYLYERNVSDRSIVKTHFYTDRSIYRPGQVVQFKGLIIASTKHIRQIKANYSTEIKLYNTNGELLSTKKVNTNDYGSYHGSFVLPIKGLNGQYRIQDEHGMHFFSVEEYKRPTFKITLDSSNVQEKLNEPLHITGKVMAYSGEAISNAKVSYKIVRRQYHNYWPYWGIYPPAREDEKVITSGLLTSRNNGSFDFDFVPSTKDLSNKGYSSAYLFEIIIDASSPSGETRTIRKKIKLSQQALFLNAELDEAIQLKELKALVINATNINGKTIETKANLSLYKLKTPEKPLIPKLWGEVDMQAIPEKELKEKFPEHQLNASTEIGKFERDYLLSSAKIICNQKLDLFKTIEPGAYEIEAVTKDQYGNAVEWRKRFVIYDPNAKELPYPMFFWIHAIKAKGEPGEEAQFLVGSSLSNFQLLYEIIGEEGIVKKEWINLKNEQRLISIPIKEVDRGNFALQFIAIHSNRKIQHYTTVRVPYTNKKLNLHLSSFRSELEPGAKEKWEIRLNDSSKPEEVELLLGMYDESLDQFKKTDWMLNLYPPKRLGMNWTFRNNPLLFYSHTVHSRREPGIPFMNRYYPQLNWFGFYLSYGYSYRLFDYNSPTPVMLADAEGVFEKDTSPEGEMALTKSAANIESGKGKYIEKKEPTINPIRKDFRETAFFFPQLKTDKLGRRTFEFLVPDALTSWKFRALAHSRDLKTGYLEETVQTRKKLMIRPNYPRFLRNGDTIVLTALVHNQSGGQLSGYTRLELFDAENEEKLDLFAGNSADLNFDLKDKESKVVDWSISVPDQFNAQAIVLRFTASSNQFSDGEEKLLPILSNRLLFTESLPLALNAGEQRSFTFDNLLESKNSKSLKHHALTLEFTPNPAWYAIQALPMITKEGEEHSEQVFSRFYANSIAYQIANSQPKIKAVFEKWSQLQPEALNSKLLQNQELKSMLIEETPWLQQAKSETEQKRRIALLFDFNRMANERTEAITKLAELQLPNGAWPWFKGMRPNRYLTQYIVEGIGKLKQMGIDFRSLPQTDHLLKRALSYLDKEIERDYRKLLEDEADLSEDHLNYRQIHYFYLRSFFQDYLPLAQQKAQKYYIKQMENFWKDRSNYMKGMIGLSLYRLQQNSPISALIVNALKDHSIDDKELGMYWKMNRGPYWYQAPIETQALMIELFDEVTKDANSIEAMKLWLLKQKQLSAWSNSKSTAMACYALLMKGEGLLNTASETSIKIADEKILLAEQQVESGTNYFKRTWLKQEVKPELGEISINNAGTSPAWGALHWQYMEDIDQIKSAGLEELSLSKAYFMREVQGDAEQIRPIGKELKVGETVVVRLRIESKRDLEFVSLKDMRPAAFEPVETISGRKYQDGLTYYQSNKDASTNFYFDWLPKGVYVFEYELKVNQRGLFSAGITELQSYYAPEFSTHSAGRMVKIID